MNHDPIHIAFCAERGYVPHAAAMLRSLLVANPDERLELYIIEGPETDPDERLRLERWLAQRGAALKHVRLAGDEPLGSDFRSSHFHRSIWYRALLPDLLPGLPKILYLDADTLVLDRIRPLWETDLSGHLFAAVVNPLYPMMPNWPMEHLGLPTRSHYMNSGVLLMDLERMRLEGCVRAIRDFSSVSRAYHGYPATEQDALATLYHARCLFLHPRWNVQTTYYELSLKDIPVDRREVREARRDPAIVHFSGPWKPSHYVCRHPYRDAYLHHRRGTPWPLAKPDDRNLKNFILRNLPVQWLWRLARLRRRVWSTSPINRY